MCEQRTPHGCSIDDSGDDDDDDGDDGDNVDSQSATKRSCRKHDVHARCAGKQRTQRKRKAVSGIEDHFFSMVLHGIR